MTTFEPIITSLEELREEGVSKNTDVLISNIIAELAANGEEDSKKINKVLAVLDEIADDVNLAADIRTQFWNISSVLESMIL